MITLTRYPSSYFHCWRHNVATEILRQYSMEASGRWAVNIGSHPHVPRALARSGITAHSVNIMSGEAPFFNWPRAGIGCRQFVDGKPRRIFPEQWYAFMPNITSGPTIEAKTFGTSH